MSTVKYIALLVVGLCLCANLAARPKDCDQKLCPGPLYYYEELGCTPVFDSASSCCPTRYNCDKLKNLPKGGCIVNGQVYSARDVLPRDAFESPCMWCTCTGMFCASPSCVGPIRRRDDCVYPMSPLSCCEFGEVCPDSPVVCTVDGKPYKAGEIFKPLAEPEKTCFCKKGYTGVNSEEFCIWPKPSWCGNIIYRKDKVLARCAPFYGENTTLHGTCSDGLVCPEEYVQTERETRYQTTVNSQMDSDNSCMFGNLTMSIGEKIIGYRPENDGHTRAISCRCEVPPVPTCRKHEQVYHIKSAIRYEW